MGTEKMSVNVVLVGHVDHGKSTLIGRLLYDSESIKDERVEEIQKLAEEYKRKFEFAYFLDSFEDELKEERTIDTVSLMFKGKKNFYTITDVPGHKEFIKNMLTGASHADVAVLVVSAEEGVQEQTRRHMFLLKMLGIKQVFVVVNKMDAVEYNKERFEEEKEQISKLLDSFDYATGEMLFIPVSAMEGDNIYKYSEHMKWYDGPTLIDALDGVRLEGKEKPLRFAVQDIYKVEDEETIVGRVESGILRRADNVVFEPSGVKAKVEKINVFDGELAEAKAGDSIGIIINGGVVKRGDVLGLLEKPPKPTNAFLGEAVLLDKNLKKGEVVEIRCGTAKVSGEIKEIREKIDSETGAVLESNPEEINEHDAATIVFATEPLVVEEFAEIPELGRFVLVKANRNIGAGVVLNADVKM
ncbi:elongation factor 1-alpha [ANME-1 cluster archaeon AG-394-G06]|nr:elongation factor 1-alpha [ANME-1 cluster archaeon AG-394-G06]